MSRFPIAAGAAALAVAMVARSVRAEIPLGPEFQVNAYTTGWQYAAALAATADGGFVVSWTSVGQDGNGEGIFGRRFDASDLPVGAGDFRVNAYTTGSQMRSRIASGGGRFVVAWSDYRAGPGIAPDVSARVFDLGTGLAGPEFLANVHTYGMQQFPDVSADPAGNFVVAWTDESAYYPLTDSSSAIVGQLFDPAGNAIAGQFQANAYEYGLQWGSRLAMDDGGNFVVTWVDAYRSDDIKARRFFAGGTPRGPEFLVNSHTTGQQYYPAVASAPDGRFVVAWATYRTGGGSDVRAQLYDNAGSAVGGEIVVATLGNPNRPQVAMDAEGQFIVVWDNFALGGDVWGQKFDALGARRGGEFRLNEQTAGYQAEPQVSVAADGSFITVWSSQAGEPDGGIRGRRFSPVVDHIFSDGFESGTLAAWSSAATDGSDLAPSIFAAMKSSQVGLQGLVDGTGGIYVEDTTPEAERRYRARFWIDPNGFDPGEATGQRRTRTFIAFSGPPARRVAAVVLRRAAGVYGVMVRARLDDNAQADTAFFTITDAPHAIEIDLQAASTADANDGSLQLWIDGVSAAHLTGLDNSRGLVDFARLGALSVKGGASGTLYWDEFVSRRGTYIGP
jgi:hypothetical protein